jgi:hypothetical protein
MSFRNPNRDDRIYREWREGWDEEYERRAAYERERGRKTELTRRTNEPDFSRSPFSDRDEPVGRRDDYAGEHPHRVNTKSFLGYGASSSVGGSYGEETNPAHESDYDRGRRGRERFEPEEGNWLDRAADEVASWFGGDERRDLDVRSGPHAGRGPKGYRRSDERIRDDVADRLTDDDRVDASDVEVTVSAGIVNLNGTVESREAKRRAEDVAASVSGVEDVVNEIRVRPAQSPTA